MDRAQDLTFDLLDLRLSDTGSLELTGIRNTHRQRLRVAAVPLIMQLNARLMDIVLAKAFSIEQPVARSAHQVVAVGSDALSS